MDLDTSTVQRGDTREESAIAAFKPLSDHDFTHCSATCTNHRGCSLMGMKIPVGMTISMEFEYDSMVIASGVTYMEATWQVLLVHTYQSGLIPTVTGSPHIGHSVTLFFIYFSSF